MAPQLDVQDHTALEGGDAERARFGPYLVLGTLGVGGMAVVYRVRHVETGQIGALKRSALPLFRGRLALEGAALARAAHPNVVRLLDRGEDFLVMEVAARGSLAGALKGGVRWNLPALAGIGVQVLAALDAAHAAGIVHRDVKPGNILFTADDRVLLADFGIAHVSGASSPPSAGSVVGSPSFMAPEQRERPDHPEPASDQYALAATLYAACARASPPHDLFAAPEDDPVWSPVPKELRPVLIRASRPDPVARFASVRAMAARLAGLAAPALWSRQPHLARWLSPDAVPNRTTDA